MSIRRLLQATVRLVGVLWNQIGLIILFLLVLDIGAGWIVRGVKHFQKRSEHISDATYHEPPWTPEYFKAQMRVSSRWYPYVYWKSAPISSRYINVDQQGNRITWNKSESQRQNSGRPLKVFTFGGSTMWGFGVRDDYTLASILSRQLAEKTDYNVQVSNYGQIGYVSSQEVLLLYQLLREGLRPDVVLFYDGSNDTFCGYQAGIAGLTHNEFYRVLEFNLVALDWSRKGRENLYTTALRTFILHTNAAQLGGLIAGWDTEDHAEPRDYDSSRKILRYLSPPREHQGENTLEQDVVNYYLFNQRVVEMLGREFGFRSLFYWQPVLYFKDKLTPFERTFVGEPEQGKFFRTTYGLMASAAPRNGTKDLADLFKHRTETMYSDGWHPTEPGNVMIAQKMTDDVAKVLGEIEQRPAGR